MSNNDQEKKFYDKIIKMREQSKDKPKLQKDTISSNKDSEAIAFFIKLKYGLYMNRKS